MTNWQEASEQTLLLRYRGLRVEDSQELSTLRAFVARKASDVMQDFGQMLRDDASLQQRLAASDLQLDSMVARQRQHLIEMVTIDDNATYLQQRVTAIRVYQSAHMSLGVYLGLQALVEQALLKAMIEVQWWQPGLLVRQVMLVNRLFEVDRELAVEYYVETLGTHLERLAADVTTSTEEMSHAARSIASTMERLAGHVNTTLGLASDGNRHVDATIVGVEHVQERVGALAARTIELSTRMNEISTVVDLIKDVTEETDILAINASVEAAGAGQHGERFGVVANEIRRLSDRVRQSAGQIEGMVYEMQSSANSAVISASSSVQQSQRGVELAHQAGTAVTQVVDNMAESVTLFGTIAKATRDQEQVAVEVAAAMREVVRSLAQLKVLSEVD